MQPTPRSSECGALSRALANAMPARYDDAMWTAIISALSAIIASAGAIILAKHKEREAAWRARKLDYHEEFFGAASGIVGDTAPTAAKVRFATAVNNLHLIGSRAVMVALHAFIDQIAESNKANMTRDRHDELWSRLVWEIRNDPGGGPGDRETFSARLWASGAGTNVVPGCG
ncbi:hypothetical protein RM533_10475 [Croceicoccus sp. F390]|uniref:Uncharacterized protein n=1 Tax=Croceicoccus esteveae TaxID=3075597 RepID=A0ABU2ZK60_9SPHN|nr:hypothetical protein [Croceicoccus sp. F390]MDT0576606.1 hypothetical protein [Croceicoccus sp. F390]